MKISAVFVDMDEVLTDFVGAALEVHGWTREAYNRKVQKTSSPVATTLGLTRAMFWEPIAQRGVQFWRDLRPTPWFSDIMAFLQGLPCPWFVVSSPSNQVWAYTGKIMWLHDHIGPDFDRFVSTSHKYLLAHPGCILIDDSEENCRYFGSYGGDAILFPAVHNRLSDPQCLADPLKSVRDSWYHFLGE